MNKELDNIYASSSYIYDEYLTFLDYSVASSRLHSLIQQLHPNAQTLLDVACGTGKHLEYLKEHYQAEGIDLNSGMLELARKRCPGLSFHQGNMIDFNLERKFDIITCLFCSVTLVKTPENLERAVATMARHLAPGGILIIEPWVSPENYWNNKLSADIVDKPELKIVRMYTTGIKDGVSVTEVHYLVGTPEGVEHLVVLDELGLFTPEDYMGAFSKAALEVSNYNKELFPGHNYGLYVGQSRR